MAEILSKGEYTILRLIDNSTVTKTATGEGAEKLAKEIAFLELNKSKLHLGFLPYIFSPEITKQYARYSMPYLSGPLMRDYIYSEPSLSSCERSLMKAVANLNSLHREPGTIGAAEFSKKFYLDRLQGRWNKLINDSGRDAIQAVYSTQNISSSDAKSLFSLIAKGTALSIDGKEISFSIKQLINSFVSLRDIFEVPQTSIRLIHGDPHAGNILLHDSEIVFLDPNGFMDGGDVAYDFGKLLVSFDWHDLSMMGLLEPARIRTTPRGIVVANNKIHKDDHTQKRHDALRQKIMELLVEKVAPLYKNDPLLLQRIKILLYIHQFSFAPTLIKEKPQTALHILLNAISDYTTLVEEDRFSFTT
jgi:hypothetical protein